MGSRKKILIIAGGGVFGVIPAHFLGMLPSQHQTLNKVDLLAGCSIGGILAAAYAAGNSFAIVDQFFQTHADQCFDKRFTAKLSPLACPTYKNESIDEVIKDMIGQLTVGDIKSKYPNLDIIIPALNITDDSYKVFDNITGQDDAVSLAAVAGMTSAAPTYYSGRQLNNKCYIDGGLIQVAPLLTATTALKAKRGIPFQDMDVLMLGTGRDIDEHPISTDQYNRLSLLGMATNVIVPYVTLSNEMATRYWGQHIGYHMFNYYNPCITDGKLDDVAQVPQLVKQCDKFVPQFQQVWDEWLEA